MNAISKFGARQIPGWAHPDHPVMRTILNRNNQGSWRRRLLQLFLLLGFIAAAVAAGFFVASDQTTNETPTLNEVLYWPLVALQTLVMVLAIFMTTNAVSVERQKQTWDSLKLSLVGVSLTLRARWAAVFYRLAPLLVVITIGRAAYLGVLLSDILEFQGRALDLRISGITPGVSLDVTLIIMALSMTAFLIQPFVAVALGAAIGLLLSVFTRTRGVVILGLLLLVGLRLALTAGGIVVGDEIFQNVGDGVQPALAEIAEETPAEAWAHLLFSSAEGDQMLNLMHLDTLGQIWTDVDYGIYVGAVMLGIVLLQAIIANVAVLFAAWSASRPTNN
jgi:hypothetical protein